LHNSKNDSMRVGVVSGHSGVSVVCVSA
jgi:hypothetical protein